MWNIGCLLVFGAYNQSQNTNSTEGERCKPYLSTPAAIQKQGRRRRDDVFMCRQGEKRKGESRAGDCRWPGRARASVRRSGDICDGRLLSPVKNEARIEIKMPNMPSSPWRRRCDRRIKVPSLPRWAGGSRRCRSERCPPPGGPGARGAAADAGRGRRRPHRRPRRRPLRPRRRAA